MDCIEALETVSAAADHEIVDTQRLAAAKEHCRGCAECGQFVSALLAVKRTPPPAPPEDLAERIIDTIKAERLRNERAAAALAAAERAGREQSTSDVTRVRRSGDVRPLKERLRDPRNRWAVAAWSSAAAVALIAAGFGAVYGTRTIMTDKSAPQQIVLESAGRTDGGVTGPFGNAAVPQGDALQATEPVGLGAGESAAADTRVAAGILVVNGVAYRSAGPDASVSKESLSPRGSTRTALASGLPVADHQVLGTDDPSRVFIESDGAMLAFDRITTSYEGRTYVLQSDPITEWGAAAVLPGAIGNPVTADGSPVFEPVDAEKTVFVRRGTDASSGIAYPPGARADVAAGWSWWLPASP